MKQAFVTVLVIIGVCGFLGAYLYSVDRIHARQFEEESRCYRDLTRIIESSSKEKNDWIQSTIIAEKSFTGTNYCRALELVKGSRNTEHR